MRGLRRGLFHTALILTFGFWAIGAFGLVRNVELTNEYNASCSSPFPIVVCTTLPTQVSEAGLIAFLGGVAGFISLIVVGLAMRPEVQPTRAFQESPPLTRKTGRPALWLVVVIVAVIAAGSLGAWAYLRQPAISVGNFRLVDSGYPCSAGINSRFVDVTFTLINRGGSGYAEVVNLLDNQSTNLLPSNYHVAAHGQTDVAQTILADCNAHWVSVEITAQWPT